MAETEQNAFPLFFKNPVLLDAKRHADAAIKGDAGYAFAKATNSIPVNATEFSMAAKHYPIVFTDEETPVPLAIVGLEQENYFIDEAGNWKEDAYIPAYVRKYPFAFAEFLDVKQLRLCVDEEAEQFVAKGRGKNNAKLYEGEKPSELTRNALEFCTAFHNHFLLTKQLAVALKKAGLLAPYQSDATLNNGRKLSLGGFLSIDQKLLSALPDKAFLELRKQGFLDPVYAVLQSLTNWKSLVNMASLSEKPKQKSLNTKTRKDTV